jgi:hypothetical protein
MAEITDQELQVLRGSKNLLDKLLSGKTKRQAEKLVKEHYPDVQTADDIAAPYVEELHALNKKFDDYVKDTKGSQLDSKLNRDIAMLKEDRSWTDEGIEKLKQMMIKEEIPSIVVAADAWEHRNPPVQQEPSIMAPTDWGFGRKTEDADLQLLFKDEDAWAEREAQRAWAEETKKRGQILT